MSSGWLSWRWNLIRICYGKFIMSSRWHTLPSYVIRWINWSRYVIRMNYGELIIIVYVIRIFQHEIVEFDFSHYITPWPFSASVYLRGVPVRWIHKSTVHKYVTRGWLWLGGWGWVTCADGQCVEVAVNQQGKLYDFHSHILLRILLLWKSQCPSTRQCTWLGVIDLLYDLTA